MSKSTWFGTPRLEAQNVKICWKFCGVWPLCSPWTRLCFTGPRTESQFWTENL